MADVNIVWLRRDLRLSDNTALNRALEQDLPVLVLFVFDEEILSELPDSDPRVQFIHKELERLLLELKQKGSSLLCKKGSPLEVWKKLLSEFQIHSVYANKDYEPYAIKRDLEVKDLLKASGVQFHAYKDQVMFEESEVVKADGSPYTVFTPFKRKWFQQFEQQKPHTVKSGNYLQCNFDFPSLESIGFKPSKINVPDYRLEHLSNYKELRDLPAKDNNTYLSPHLRFGTISIREVWEEIKGEETLQAELVWREFFMQILYHYPRVVSEPFKEKYSLIEWRNNEDEFKRWCKGETGYPMVDAGMRELNETGFMHGRTRMVTASFLCKHLLIDWRWGEAYFAEKLLDYELSSNNGNWQWCAGTGCDSAPYFRVFNPALQQQRFDPKLEYINKWVPELNDFSYPKPVVEHKMARQRALDVYKSGLEAYGG